MEKNAIIFNCIAAAAKVVFNHLIINPGNYTAPALSPDDLADIYAAYLAAAASPDCGPVLSSPATTAAATAAPAVDVATVPGDTVPGDTLPAPVLGL